MYQWSIRKRVGAIVSISTAFYHNIVWLWDVDGLFCHQMPIYTILAGPVAKLYGKKVVSWYMHRSIEWKMKLMEKIANIILSASKESFRLPSKKLIITGHGIDTDLFKIKNRKLESDNLFNVVSVGRISPTKNYESMIEAVDILSGRGLKKIKLTLENINADSIYSSSEKI